VGIDALAVPGSMVVDNIALSGASDYLAALHVTIEPSFSGEMLVGFNLLASQGNSGAYTPANPAKCVIPTGTYGKLVNLETGPLVKPARFYLLGNMIVPYGVGGSLEAVFMSNGILSSAQPMPPFVAEKNQVVAAPPAVGAAGGITVNHFLCALSGSCCDATVNQLAALGMSGNGSDSGKNPDLVSFLDSAATLTAAGTLSSSFYPATCQAYLSSGPAYVSVFQGTHPDWSAALSRDFANKLRPDVTHPAIGPVECGP
jgi:hypothetical protein